MPGGCGGKTLGPPTFSFSRPADASAMSRTISASTRKRGPRASSTFGGLHVLARLQKLAAVVDLRVPRDGALLHHQGRDVLRHRRLQRRDLLLLRREQRCDREEMLAQTHGLLMRAFLFRREHDLLHVR